MVNRVNYYKDLEADYSRPGLISEDMKKKLIEKAEKITAMKEATLPEINGNYSLKKIETENKEWWADSLRSFETR